VADFVQTLINAVTAGSLYALIALGYTMVYGILKFINFAHSDVFVLGAWSAVTVSGLLVAALTLDAAAMPWWIGPVVLVIAMGVCATVGFTIERLAYKPLRKAPRLNVLITAMGVSLFMQNVGMLQFDLSRMVPGTTLIPETPGLLAEDGQSVTLPAPLEPRRDWAYFARIRDASGTTVTRRLAIDQAVTALAPGARVSFAGDPPRTPIDPSSARVSISGGPRLALPFGARPERGPQLIDQRGLIPPSVIARGTLTARSRVAVQLDEPVELRAGRNYALRFRTSPDSAWTTTGVINPKNNPDLSAEADPPGVLRTGQAVPRGVTMEYELLVMPVVQITLAQVVVLINAVTLMALLQVLVFRTKIGTAMRAVSFSIDNSALMGINVSRVISFTFVLGASLAAAAGVLQTQLYPTVQQPASEAWVQLGLKAFVAAVVGGIGNIRGAVIGGFLIAFIEFFATRYIDSRLTNLYVFVVLVAVLLLRPEGILGKPTREKV
jgi:branched-subunit amino acid ABC-type transport system permease component